ncbi:MAG: MlaD family protein [Actinomycetota bacterium]|nr:MlaD family protein [Actinomycetota bacterium]
MQTQAPSIGKILVAVGFALSCFALLLFLWVTFGGPVPFKPQSYRFSADFPEAITLQKEADVRIGGVSVGKVKGLELPEDGNATRAVMEIDSEFAPISSDANAILRQKTLLGETYIELTTGSQVDPDSSGDQTAATGATDANVTVGQLSGDDAAHPIEEGGHLDSSQVVEQVQIDEIFNALDDETRQAFQLWMKNSGIAIDGRGLDLNDAFGNVGPFSADASDVLGTLRRQEQALRDVVRNTGVVFDALTAREQDLAGAVVGSNRTFRALASRDESLAQTFQILPTFETESRLTLQRLERFARKAGPLFHDLRPVAKDISPTLRDLRRLAPNARRLFRNLDPLIKASETGLPALTRTLDQLRPLMIALDPFLANLNPIVRYLDFYKAVASDFLGNPSAGTAGTLPEIAGQPGPRHISRQMAILNAESVSVYPQRLATNRGNAYLLPGAIGNPISTTQDETFPSFDCANTGATGGIGSEQVTYPPADGVGPEGGFPGSTPPAQEGGSYPGSNLVTPTSLPVPVLPAPFDLPIGGAQAAFAPCLLQPTAMGLFPAEFGGGDQPQILPDP